LPGILVKCFSSSTLFNINIFLAKPVPRTQYTSQYSDQLYKYSSPGSIRRPVGASPRGWTSVTEATTITFAKRHSFDRTTEEGKVQHVVEVFLVLV